MRKTPIAVTGLRPAPAIIVNRGDEVSVRRGWYVVIDYTPDRSTVLVKGSNSIFAVHVDQIEEWRRG